MKILYLAYGDSHPDIESQEKVLEYTRDAFSLSVPEIKTEKIDNLGALNLEHYDALILFFHIAEDNNDIVTKIIEYADNGGTVLALHGAAASFKGNDTWFDFLGGRFVSHPPLCEFFVESDAFSGKITDEIYFVEFKKDIKIYAFSKYQGDKIPCLWARDRDIGRVVYLSLGHDIEAVSSDTFLKAFNLAVSILTTEKS